MIGAVVFLLGMFCLVVDLWDGSFSGLGLAGLVVFALLLVWGWLVGVVFRDRSVDEACARVDAELSAVEHACRCPECTAEAVNR